MFDINLYDNSLMLLIRRGESKMTQIKSDWCLIVKLNIVIICSQGKLDLCYEQFNLIKLSRTLFVTPTAKRYGLLIPNL